MKHDLFNANTVSTSQRRLFCLSGSAIILLALLILAPAGSALSVPDAGQGDADGIWREAQITGMAEPLPARYRLVAADVSRLKAALAQAPLEGHTGQPAVLALPLPDGRTAHFRIEEYSMMEPGLAAKFPEFKTYLGWGVDDPTAAARLSWTAAGFQATLDIGSRRFVIAPYRRGDATRYMCFDEQDAIDQDSWGDDIDTVAVPHEPRATNATSRSHATRHTYRLAVATTGEYAQEQGGTITQTLAAIVNTINAVNGIYERDFSIRLALIANNDQIIYTDGDADPYTDSDASAILGENQANLDAVIGRANYDVGHCFRSASSGVATLGTPCIDGYKARGTGSGSVLQTAHEVGHQFNSHHTQNASNCSRADYQAYEPGSGSTIMSYAGQCNQSILDSGEGRNDYFHVSSMDRVIDYVTLYEGSMCGAHTETGNTAPAVEAGPDYTIPARTPFVLNGSGSDADGDALTYTWEEFDLGAEPYTTTVPNRDDDGNARPILRSFSPITSPVRILPRLVNILDGSYYGPGESLPTIDRDMQFRLIARDGQGGVSDDAMTVTVAGSAGPFRVTFPTGVMALPRASQQTVSWDVAGTAAAPVSCSHINILLSTDGGNSFPTTLAANTPNDGKEAITLPNTPPTSLLVKVECANNIFFDISSIGPTLCTSLFHDDHEDGFEDWTVASSYGDDNWQGRTDGGYSGNNYWFIDDENEFNQDSYLASPTITVRGISPTLVFIHKYELEMKDSNYASDGGVVEIKVNDGQWVDVGDENYIQNGYSTVVTTTNYSPIGGRPAFSGDSKGYIQSMVDLGKLVAPEDSVHIRFRMVKDGWYRSSVEEGWSVDDVLLCRSDPVPVLSIDKSVAFSGADAAPGSPLTYTIVLANQGGAIATEVHVTDTLPAYVIGTNLDQVLTVAANSRVTLTIPATLDVAVPDGTVVQNTAHFVHTSGTAYWPDTQRQGQASARFIVGVKMIYLPLILRNT